MAGIRLGKKIKLSAEPSFVIDAGEVAREAYVLYERRGCQPGHELDDWLEAEDVVRRRCAIKKNLR